METESFKLLRQALTEAETDFSQQKEQFSAFAEIIWSIDKLHSIEERERNSGIDTAELQKLINKSETEILHTLQDTRGCLRNNQDLKQWSENLRLTVRFHDPCILSFNSVNDSVSNSSANRALGKPARSSFITILKRDSEFLKGIEQSNQGKLSRVSSLTLFVWSVAILATFVAVGFLTYDYVQSRRNPLLNVEWIPTKMMEFPAISICSNVAGLPSFEDFPNENYPGHALFAVTEVRARSEIQDDAPKYWSYPATIPQNSDSNLEIAYVGDSVAKCENEVSKMSTRTQREALFKYTPQRHSGVSNYSADSACRKCFRFGSKRPLLAQQGVSPSTMAAIQITAGLSGVYRSCALAPSYLSAERASKFLLTEITSHSSNLEDAQVLSFGAAERKSAALSHLSNGADALENMCNIYFFSGYFYPSEDIGSVSFRYQANTSSWVSSGNSYFSRRTWELWRPFTFGFDTDGVYKDVYFTTAPELFFENPKVSSKSVLINPATPGNVVEHGSKSTFLFSRSQNEQGSITYGTTKSATPSESSNSGGIYDYFVFEFDYKTFVTTHSFLRPSMSSSEYVTDIFEFLGLFTGICVFSLIVAPAQTLV